MTCTYIHCLHECAYILRVHKTDLWVDSVPRYIVLSSWMLLRDLSLWGFRSVWWVRSGSDLSQQFRLSFVDGIWRPMCLAAKRSSGGLTFHSSTPGFTRFSRIQSTKTDLFGRVLFCGSSRSDSSSKFEARLYVSTQRANSRKNMNQWSCPKRNTSK